MSRNGICGSGFSRNVVCEVMPIAANAAPTKRQRYCVGWALPAERAAGGQCPPYETACR